MCLKRNERGEGEEEQIKSMLEYASAVSTNTKEASSIMQGMLDRLGVATCEEMEQPCDKPKAAKGKRGVLRAMTSPTYIAILMVIVIVIRIKTDVHNISSKKK